VKYTCLIILYTAFVVVLFKFKLIRARPVPIAGVVLLGIVLIGGIVVWWMLSAPMSSRVVVSQYVVQIVPYVKGQVKQVAARPNQPIKKGDLLIEIDPAPYQFAVNQLSAQFHAAEENVKQSQAGLEAAKANVVKSNAAIRQAQAGIGLAKANVAEAQATVKKAVAAVDLAKADLAFVLNVQKNDPGAVSKQKMEQAQQNVKEKEASQTQAEAVVTQAQAGVLQAEANLAETQAGARQAEASERQSEFSLKMVQSNVQAVQAELDNARFNLGQCRVTAPADGYVVDWQVREGTMIVPMPMSPAGTFIVTSETNVVAVFPQNYLTHVQPGNEVELVLDPYPGKLFKGTVNTVIQATGEGEFAPNGTIPRAASIGSQGMLAVKIKLTADSDAVKVPLGAGGAVTIYTDAGKPVHIISKVTIRMKKWLLYVLPA
jgi:multidrug resistance efflux pump